MPTTWKSATLAGLLAASFGAGWVSNGWRLSERAQIERADRAETAVSAVTARVAENKSDETRHAAINQKIEVTKNEELAPVVRRIADAPRLRVGTAICPSPAARTPETESTGGSDAADTSGRLVREDLDRDIKALMKKVEEDLATGRACQAFVKENGLAP